MTFYVDEIIAIVSFNVKDNYKYEYKLNDIKYCPNCKICHDVQCFRSLNNNQDYNKYYVGDA